MATPENCRQCGACCYSASARYVIVTGADWERLGEAAETTALFIGNRAYLRMQDNHCAALAIRRGLDGQADFFCTIYERRPQVCRELDRGSPQCEGERLLKAPLARTSRVVR